MAETLVAMLGLILHDFMSRMQTCVPPQEIIRRVTSASLPSAAGVNGQVSKAPSNSGHHFAEYREVMLNMIQGQASERAEGLLMRDMIAADLQTLGAAKYQVLVSEYIYEYGYVFMTFIEHQKIRFYLL